MLGWLVLIAATVAMYRITDAEGKNAKLWALITFAICLGCAVLIPLPLLNIGIGAIASFMAYFIWKVVKNE